MSPRVSAPIGPEELTAFAADILERLNVPVEDAQLVADSLVKAELWGHSSHGLLRLPWRGDPQTCLRPGLRRHPWYPGHRLVAWPLHRIRTASR